MSPAWAETMRKRAGALCGASAIRLAIAMTIAVLAGVSAVASPALAQQVEPVQSDPAANSVLPTAPSQVQIVFGGAVNPDGTTIQVIGPGGIQIDLSDAALDPQDATRVTVSLRSDLDVGSYSVQWVSVAAADGSEARGSFSFTVGSGTPVAGAPAAIEPSPTATPAIRPLTGIRAEGDEYDSQGYLISVIVGLVFAVLIFVFWRIIRPKDAKFR